MLMISGKLPEDALSRLKILAENHDGFEIAQKDLMLRGHGEIAGTRQSGFGELDIAEIIREQDMLFKVKGLVHELIKEDPELLLHENRLLRIMMESIWGVNLSL